MKEIKRGDIFVVNLDPVKGSEQGGLRPCVVIQNDVGNKHSPTVIVSPITSRLKKRDMPTHVMLPQMDGFPAKSMIMLEHLRTLDKKRLGKFMTVLDPELMDRVDSALAVSVGLAEPKYEEMELCLCPICAKQFFDSNLYIIKRSPRTNSEKGLCCYCNVRTGYDYRVISKQKPAVSSV